MAFLNSLFQNLTVTEDRLVDLVLINNPDIVNIVHLEVPLGESDYFLVKTKCKMCYPEKK